MSVVFANFYNPFAERLPLLPLFLKFFAPFSNYASSFLHSLSATAHSGLVYSYQLVANENEWGPIIHYIINI